MSTRNLEALFWPRSVAVIGASNRPRSVGNVTMRNLLDAGFEGPTFPVHPRDHEVAGIAAYASVSALPEVPDLAVIATPAATVPGIVADLAAAGTRAAIVLSAGLRDRVDESDTSLQQAMLDAARPALLRILGPNCVGFLNPRIGLNASFAHTSAPSGRIAFVTQSGALATAVLDWSRSTGVGFSCFVSLGDAADIDVADLLDYLQQDEGTDAILLYVEGITHARKFMSAARAAARTKPVVVMKSGRMAEGARAAHSHTGALIGADDVFDAAFQRAGLLRVFALEDLFGAASTLGSVDRLPGDRLAIITNGGGPGVLATDALVAGGGRLAELSSSTLGQLDAVLPPTWSGANPVDLIGDAGGERYAQAVRIVLEDEGVDVALVMYVPTAITSATETATAVIKAVPATNGRVLTSWLGMDGVEPARALLRAAGFPTYNTPAQAVGAFLQLVQYQQSQEMLLETPALSADEGSPDRETARAVIEGALRVGRSMLTEPEAKAVVEAYGIPTVPTRTATSSEEAVDAAAAFGYPVAVKLLSPDISHKSDVGGVVLDVGDGDAVAEACRAITERTAERRPEARLEGFTVQPMIRRAHARELLVGALTDATFGPVIALGRGGTEVELFAQRAIALPPLSENLADDLIRRSGLGPLLGEFRDHPQADRGALRKSLARVGRLMAELPEVIELDINPLLIDEQGVLALDARIRVAVAGGSGVERLAIRPYPEEFEERATLRSGLKVLLRPIKPEDEPAQRRFFEELRPSDIYFRFFDTLREMSHPELARYTQIDYDREMAFLVQPMGEGEAETIGFIRSVSDPEGESADFALVVGADWQERGLGYALLEKLLRYGQQRGLREISAEVLLENEAMLDLAASLGFEREATSDPTRVLVRKTLGAT